MSQRFWLSLIALASCWVTPAKAGIEGFDCSLALSAGDTSIRQFTLTEDVYRCMRHANYADVMVINRQGEPVPWHLNEIESTVKTESYDRPLRFYTEPSPPAYETGEQIRRIAQLTGLSSSTIDSAQRQLANQHYSSLILERAEPLDTLRQLTINAQTDGTPVIATLVIEHSVDMKHWVTRGQPQVIRFLVGSDGQFHQNTVTLDSTGQFKYVRLAMLSNRENFAREVTSVSGQFEPVESEDRAVPWHWLKAVDFEAMEKAGEWGSSLPGLFPVTRLRFTPAANVVFYEGVVFIHPYNNPSLVDQADRLHAQSREKIKHRLKQALHGGGASGLQTATFWQHRADFSHYQLLTKTGSMVSADVELPVTYAEQWKFDFQQPAALSREQLPLIEFGWQPRQITFLAQGEGPFQLLVGRDKPALRPQFPRHLLELAASAHSVELLPATSTAVTAAAQSAQVNAAENLWEKALLWSLLCVGVGLMLTMAYRLSNFK